MSFRSSTFILAALAALAGSCSAPADVTLPAIFSDHMVLRRKEKVPVWGHASPGEHVTVKIGDISSETEAGADGKWRTQLDLHAQTDGPFTLTVTGKNTLTISDVLIGEVWLCGGQSNMELTVSRTIGAPAEIAASANPQIRMFSMKRTFALEPAEDCEGKWLVAGPGTTGNFTAVGYYFAKRLQQSLHVPVGLINDNYGGSVIEAWLGYDAIAADPDLKATADKLLADAKSYPEKLKDFQAAYKTWSEQNQRIDRPIPDVNSYAGPDIATSDWKTINLPGKFATQGLPDAGAVWLRQNIDVPMGATTSYLTLHLDGIHDFDHVYWNGAEIGSTTPEKTTSYNDSVPSSLRRRYDIAQTAVKSGRSVLAIRVFSPGGGGGVDGKIDGGGIRITGQWQAKAEYEFPPLSAAAQAAYPVQPPFLGGQRNIATELYNGMLHPVEPYALRGFLWYQGESNTGRAVQYKGELAELIREWRADWGEGDIPFYYCQLANYMAKKPTPTESAWAEIRESMTSDLSLPNTGQAILIDLGESDDIHYRNKKDAGDRVALIALANTYEQKVAFSGPMYSSSTVEGHAIRVKFTHTDGGLVAKTLPATYQPKTLLPQTVPLIRNSPKSELEGFAICGADHRWVWADATIDGDSVVVSSSDVPAPVAVRYAWADNPTCNLYNGAGLPAGPFRTDNFPLLTEKNKY
jgi:sialate O-acetylesterase